jgi:signal transduction histidine kinase
LQLAMFVASGLVWQSVNAARFWLPLLERSASLLSLVIIVWLWSFPNPYSGIGTSSSSHLLSPIDVASLTIWLLVLVGCIFGSIWWIRQDLDQVLNGSSIDIVFQIAGILGAVIGLIILAVLRPAQWGYGVVMVLLLGVGAMAHLIYLPYGQDYPSITRLFEIAAFTFLLLLPGRAVFQTALGLSGHAAEIVSASEPGNPVDQEVVDLLTDDSLWKPLFKLLGESEIDQIANRASAILARIGQAELALIALPPKNNEKIEILGGYDGRNKRYLPATFVETNSLPVLISCFKMGRVRRLGADSNAADIASIMKIFGSEQVGNIILLPVLQSDGKPMAGVVLVAPDAQKEWTPKEQSTVSQLSKLLVQFLQRMNEITSLKIDLNQARESNRATQEQVQLMLEEKLKLRDQLAVLQENAHRDHEQIIYWSALVADRASLQATIEKMQMENEQLQDAIRQANEAASREREREIPLDGELRLALEEIAILSTVLADAESEIRNLETNQGDVTASSKQLEIIQSIGQDLRQTLASIVGYTDLLLGESIGILGATQRKYLERIKLSTERFNRLIDDLAQASMAESNLIRIEREEFDLSAMVQKAIDDTNRNIQMKRVILKTNLPDQPLKIISDPKALRKVITQLLHNAGSVTPEGGEIGVAVYLESSENKMDYVIVQVRDRGGGIAAQDIPRVFTLRSKNDTINGLGRQNVDFFRFKTLVEVLGGRTWVDSEPGVGATFSILLPVVPDQVVGDQSVTVQ